MSIEDEYPLCKGCGNRMTQQDVDTGTHPNVTCYRERIKRLLKKVKDLRSEISQFQSMQWYADRYTINEMQLILDNSKNIGYRIWQLIDQGYLTFDKDWSIVIHPDVKKAMEALKK